VLMHAVPVEWTAGKCLVKAFAAGKCKGYPVVVQESGRGGDW
jgi:hypothetical protein